MCFEVITEIASPLISCVHFVLIISVKKKQGIRKQMTLEGRPLKYIQCLIILFIICSNHRKIIFKVDKKWVVNLNNSTMPYCTENPLVWKFKPQNGKHLEVASPRAILRTGSAPAPENEGKW